MSGHVPTRRVTRLSKRAKTRAANIHLENAIPGHSLDLRPGRPSQYLYRPLRGGQFRLLRILSTVDNSIIAEMNRFSTQEHPPAYNALSYVWDDGQPDHEIVTSNGRLSVTKHLSDAIVAVYSFLIRRKRRDMWIWIDAICIDQSNLTEKANQVPLMGDIYRKANTVLVWFGRLHGHGLDCFNLMKWCWYRDHRESGNLSSVSKKALEKDLARGGIRKVNLEAFFEALLMLVDLSRDETKGQEDFLKYFRDQRPSNLWHIAHQVWSHLLTLLHHPWFLRIWTIQEVALANHAALLIDENDINSEFLIWFRNNVTNTNAKRYLYSEEIALQIEPNMWGAMAYNRHRAPRAVDAMTSQDDHTFQILLPGIRGHRSSEKKDHIYGILGMVDNEIRERITIDYSCSTSVEQVFTEAVVAACQVRNGARFWPFLMEWYADDSPKPAGLPSWVPDFSSRFHGGDGLYLPTRPRFSRDVDAKYEHLARFTIDETAATAIVRGMCLDHVQSGTTVSLSIDWVLLERIRTALFDPPDWDRTSNYTRILEIMTEHGLGLLFGSQLKSWLREMDRVFPSNYDDPQALPVWADTPLFGNTPSYDYHYFRQFVDHIHAQEIQTLSEGLQTTTQHDLVTFATCMFYLLVYTAGRYVFHTSAGRVGLAPSKVAHGDSICMIPGRGSNLHVLSPDCDSHVVAQVAVDGFMDSDLLDVLPLQEDEWEDFHLR